MIFLKEFKDWKINENEGNHEYGCVMLNIDMDLSEIQNKIKKEDIYIDDEDTSYGLEKTPHITLLYGLHDDEFDEKELIDICSIYEFTDIELKNISLFENEKFDVLKFDINYDLLHEINEQLKFFPNTNSYDTYVPHSTIAYLKPGKGSEYVKMFEDSEFMTKPTEIIYNKADNTKVNIEIRYIENKKD